MPLIQETVCSFLATLYAQYQSQLYGLPEYWLERIGMIYAKAGFWLGCLVSEILNLCNHVALAYVGTSMAYCTSVGLR